MAGSLPFDQLVGPLTLYAGPVGETVPAVNATPSGNWAVLGSTIDDQELNHGGEAELLYDNEHQGPVKAVVAEEMIAFTFTLVGLTLENYAKILQDGTVASDAGPPATKTINLKKGYIPDEFALLLKGLLHSPYGAFPGMYVIPRGFFGGEPAPTFTKAERAALEVEYTALEDDTQAAGAELGWYVAQTA